MYVKVWKSHLYLDRTTQLVQGWTWVDSPESSIISHFTISLKCKIKRYQKSQIFTCFANCSSGSVTESARYSTFFVQNKASNFPTFLWFFLLRKIHHIWKFKQKCEIFHFWAGKEWKGGGDMNTKCQYLSSHPCREYQIRSKTISSLSKWC